MELTASQKVKELATGIFTELANRKEKAFHQGHAVIDLSVGSPDLPPPVSVMETLSRSVLDPLQYGYSLKGTAAFHDAVAAFYRNRYGVDLDASREVLQLMGSQDGLAHLATAVIDPGDYVLVPDPGYPIYEASVTLAGGVIYPMPLTEANHFLPDLSRIPEDIAKNAKLMIISYPGNPVTALAGKSFFEKVIAFAKQHQILVLHDFAYSELIFDGNPRTSFLQVPGALEVGIEFNSLSKTFNMAGCRIGYAVGNPQALGMLAALKSNIDYGVFLPIQKAAEIALTTEYAFLDQQVAAYEHRRDTLIHALQQSGWTIAKPQATMFVWAKIPGGWKSRDFAFRLLDQAGVAVVPGDAFGAYGEGFVRIALVQPAEQLAAAAERIRLFLEQQA